MLSKPIAKGARTGETDAVDGAAGMGNVRTRPRSG